MMMKNLTTDETAALLAQKDHFTILTHRRPDGDTVSSAALLCRGLRQLGKTAHVLTNPEITEKYAHLHEGLTKPEAEDADTLVCVDVASPGMLPACFAPLQKRIFLRIDHHGTATPFTPYALVDAKSASCAEVLYDVLMQMGVQLDVPMADALYIGLSTDTGCFRYANTNAHTFRTAAACAEAGAHLSDINQALFETNTLGRLRVQGYLTEHARFLQGGRMVICCLPKEVEQRLGLTEDDLDNISGFPRTFEGVKLAATIRQESESRVKLSVRAVPGYDAAAVCAKFGGGGHKGAAGASMDMTMEQAAAALMEILTEL